MNKNKAFTLIELLVVLFIIGILIGIVASGIGKARTNAKKSQAQVEMKAIETAVLDYFREYGKLPVPSSIKQGELDLNFKFNPDASTDAQEIITILTAEDKEINETKNVRHIQFLEPQRSRKRESTTTGLFLDPWGVPYEIALDTDYDQQIVVDETIIKKRVAVISLGLFKLQGSTDESHVIRSWQ